MHREEIIVHSILMAQTRLLVWMFSSHYLSLHFVPTAASLWHPLCTSEILPTSSGKMTLCKVLTMQSRIINEEAHSVSFTVLYLTHPLWLQVSAHHRVCGSCHLLCINNNSTALWEGVTNNLSLRKLSSFRDCNYDLWNRKPYSSSLPPPFAACTLSCVTSV